MVLLRPAKGYRCDRRWCGLRGAGMCGVHDILAKSLGDNAINVVHATVRAQAAAASGGRRRRALSLSIEDVALADAEGASRSAGRQRLPDRTI